MYLLTNPLLSLHSRTKFYILLPPPPFLSPRPPTSSPKHQVKNSINQKSLGALNTHIHYRTKLTYKKISAQITKASHFLRNRETAAPSQNHLMRMGYALVRKEFYYPADHFWQIYLLFQAFVAGTATLKFLLVLVSSKSFRTSPNFFT